MLHPWLIALDLLPWDAMADEAVEDLHDIERRVGELLALTPQELSQIGPQHKTLAVRRILESPHFVSDQVADFKVTVRMPGAAEVVVRFDPRCNSSMNSVLRLSPVNNPANDAKIYGEDSGCSDWSEPATFTEKPDGIEFVYDQKLEPGRRYYGWKCEVIGTAVGERLPFIADLHSSLTHVLGGHALQTSESLPTEGACLLYVKGIATGTTSTKFRQAARQLCKVGDLVDVGVLHTEDSEHCFGFIRLGSLEDFEAVKADLERFAGLLGESLGDAIYIEDAQESNVAKWLRNHLLQRGIATDKEAFGPELQLALSIFGGVGGKELTLLSACSGHELSSVAEGDGAPLSRNLSNVANTALRKIFAVLVYHLGLSQQALTWLGDDSHPEVPSALRSCHLQAVDKLNAYQRGNIAELTAPMTEDAEEFLLSAISSRLEFLLSVCPALAKPDSEESGAAVDGSPLKETLSATTSALRVVPTSTSTSDALMNFIFDVQVDVSFLRAALEIAGTSAENLLSQMTKAQHSVRSRSAFETEHEAKYGSMPALRFRRLVCSQLLQLRPGIQSRQYGDLVSGCGESRKGPVIDAAHSLVSDAVDAMSALEDGDGAEPEPEAEEPEFKFGDDEAVQAVQEMSGYSKNVAMWALYEAKHSVGDERTMNIAKEWAIGARGPKGPRGPEFDDKSLPKDAYVQPGGKSKSKGPLSATKDTQEQCIALVACSVLWRKCDALWLMQSSLFERLFSGAMNGTPGLQRLYWALLNSIVLTSFNPEDGSESAESTTALQAEIISSLLKHFRRTDVSKSAENSRRIIALLATCFPSVDPTSCRTTNLARSDAIRVLSDMVLPVVAEDVPVETKEAAAPVKEFKHEMEVAVVVSFTAVSENVARWTLYGTQGDVQKAIEKILTADPVQLLEQATKPLPDSAFTGSGETEDDADGLAMQLIERWPIWVATQGNREAGELSMSLNAAKKALHYTRTTSLNEQHQVERCCEWFVQNAAAADINDEFEPPATDSDRPVYEYNDRGRWVVFDDATQALLNQHAQSGRPLRYATPEGQTYTIDFRRMTQTNDETGNERRIRTATNDVAVEGNAFQLESTDITFEILATLRRIFATTTPDQCADVLAEIRPKMTHRVVGDGIGSTVVSLFLQKSEAIGKFDRFALGLLIQLSHCPTWGVALYEFVQAALTSSVADVARGEVPPVCSMALALNGGLGEIVRLGADVRLEDGDARVVKFQQGQAKASVSMAGSSIVKEVELRLMSPFCTFNLDVTLLEPMLPVAAELLQQAQSGTTNIQIMHAASLVMRAICQHITLFPDQAMPQLVSAQLIPRLAQIALLSLETLKRKGSKNISQFLHELEESAAALCQNIGNASASQMIANITTETDPALASAMEPEVESQGAAESTEPEPEAESECAATEAAGPAFHEATAELGMWTTGFVEHEDSSVGGRSLSSADGGGSNFESSSMENGFGTGISRTRSGVGIDRAQIWKNLLRMKNAETQLIEDYTNLARFSAARAVLMLLEQPSNDMVYAATNSEEMIRLLHIAMMTDFSPKVKTCLKNMIAIDSMALKLEKEAVRNISSTQFLNKYLGPVTQTLSSFVTQRQSRNRGAVDYVANLGFENVQRTSYLVGAETKLANDETLGVSGERCPSATTVTAGAAPPTEEVHADSDTVCVKFERPASAAPTGANGIFKVTATGDTDAAAFECRTPARGACMEGSIRIEGASGLLVEFDRACELGDNDHIIFVTPGRDAADRSNSYQSSQSRFNGRDSGSFHQRPITIPGCELFFLYDVGSREDRKWGVKFSVRATKASLDPVATANLDVSLLSLECILENRAAKRIEAVENASDEPEPEPVPEMDVTVKTLDKSKQIVVQMPRSGTVGELVEKVVAAGLLVKNLVFAGKPIFPGDELKTMEDYGIQPGKAVVCILASAGSAVRARVPAWRRVSSAAQPGDQLLRWAGELSRAAMRVPGEPRRKLLRLLTKTVTYANSTDVALQVTAV